MGAFLVVVLVAAPLTWRAGTDHVLDQVTVTWTGAPECEGTRLLRDGHTIAAAEGMSCVVTVQVHNRSGRTVHLEQAIEPFLGPEAGPVMVAAPVGEQDLRRSDISGIDAALRLDRDLDAGETYTLPLRIVWRPDGCTGGGTMWVYTWPQVTMNYLGRHATAYGDQDLSIHRGKQNPGCGLT